MSSAAAIKLASVVFCGALRSAAGHGYVAMPPLRGGIAGNTANGYCPHCGNGAGVCGDGGQWPNSADFLNFGARTVTNLQAGTIQEFEVHVTAHHKGHFEFAICDEHVSGASVDPQACFDAGKLHRADRPQNCVANDIRGDCQPIHAEYPERWYLPPGNGTHKMRFKIPEDLSCTSCTLQWRWWTANSCVPAPNYGCFFQLLVAEGWDVSAWCGEYCGTCGEYQAGHYNCGEQFRNCADVAVLSGDAPPVVGTATVTVAPALTSSPATSTGTCVWNRDCSSSAWCNDPVYEAWCPLHQDWEACPSPQCYRAGDATSTLAMTTTPPSESSPTFLSRTASTTTTTGAASATSTTASGAPIGQECVSQALLQCINDASLFWPRCSPSQAKNNVGPAGYEFGLYCTEEWASALNDVLRDPMVDKCGNTTATHILLAQIAYETGYFSTLYQPIDGGAGLIHMLPQNWPVNVGHMDVLWPGMNYISKLAMLQEKFFQTPEYGWRSVAAWYLSTNHVIPGCAGKNLFELDFDAQTRCILGWVVDRSEAYNIVGNCLAMVSPPPATTTTTTRSPATCLPIGHCGQLGFCNQLSYARYCDRAARFGTCPAPFCADVSR